MPPGASISDKPTDQLNAPQQPTETTASAPTCCIRATANAMGNYAESYQYDEVGNILKMIHTAAQWRLDAQLPIRPGQQSLVVNQQSLRLAHRCLRLRCARQHDQDAAPVADAVGFQAISFTRLPGKWSPTALRRQPGTCTTPADNACVRSRTILPRPDKRQPAKLSASIVGGFEIYREYGSNGGTVTLERETLHIMDDKQRIALVETKTVDVSASAGTLPETLIRYQFSNHLGSASLELDQQAQTHLVRRIFPLWQHVVSGCA